MQAVESLVNTPILADCAIRLGRRPKASLQDLARKAAVRTVGLRNYQDESPFRFLDLPYTLRSQIFEYTDLVTPLSEVNWSPTQGFYLHYSTWRCGHMDCPANVHHGCQFRNYWQYANTGSFCSRYHATYASTCRCWSPPTSLFLVCRTLHEDAQAIFAKNRFVIAPIGGCFHSAESTRSRLEASIFLKDVMPLNALPFLRFLDIIIPPFEDDYLRPNEPAYQEWLETIDWIKGKLCLSMLMLRICAADCLMTSINTTTYRSKITQEQAQMILGMYGRTVAPLSRLNSLHRFFAHFAWPFAWTQIGRRLLEDNLGLVQQQVQKWEQMAEEIVMGNDYNSNELGKGKQGNSQWMEQWLKNAQWALITE
ncbi:MAG: hypothetical protein Q9181_001976 [Wetmoreana brouardii]